MKTSTAILGFAFGAAVGAAAGVMFAPRRGTETRRAVKDFIKEHCPKLKGKNLSALAERITEELVQTE